MTDGLGTTQTTVLWTSAAIVCIAKLVVCGGCERRSSSFLELIAELRFFELRIYLAKVIYIIYISTYIVWSVWDTDRRERIEQGIDCTTVYYRV